VGEANSMNSMFPLPKFSEELHDVACRERKLNLFGVVHLVLPAGSVLEVQLARAKDGNCT
jgi:hypothetical protein